MEPAAKRARVRAPQTRQKAGAADRALDAAMRQVKERIYAACTARRRNGPHWMCAKFINENLISQLVSHGGIGRGDHFLDIGSATGNVVVSVAARAGCRATGVEVVEHNHRIAVEALGHLRREKGLPCGRLPRVEFHCADMREWLPPRVGDYSVVWMSNKMWPARLDDFVRAQLRRFRPGTRVFVSRNLIPHGDAGSPSQAEDRRWFTFRDIPWPKGGAEWDDPGDTHFYLYTRTDYTGAKSAVKAGKGKKAETVGKKRAAKAITQMP